eukprot:m.273722 g.273722  ORF g.273722 m.273722 type:complete len:223 (+) comp19341_c0_seq1:2478-3146(+)
MRSLVVSFNQLLAVDLNDHDQYQHRFLQALVRLELLCFEPVGDEALEEQAEIGKQIGVLLDQVQHWYNMMFSRAEEHMDTWLQPYFESRPELTKAISNVNVELVHSSPIQFEDTSPEFLRPLTPRATKKPKQTKTKSTAEAATEAKPARKRQREAKLLAVAKRQVQVTVAKNPKRRGQRSASTSRLPTRHSPRLQKGKQSALHHGPVCVPPCGCEWCARVCA